MKHHLSLKRLAAALLLAVMLGTACTAGAEYARFVTGSFDTAHGNHLRTHLGSKWCRCTGSKVLVRSGFGTGTVMGHLERADQFELLDVNGAYAFINVTYAAPTSPDSYVGMAGWVHADYIECICTASEYLGGTTHEPQVGTIVNGTAALREVNALDSRVLLSLPAGTTVTVLSPYTSTDGLGWYRVALATGMSGFVRDYLVSLSGDFVTTEAAVVPVATVEPQIIQPTQTLPYETIIDPSIIAETVVSLVNVRALPDINSQWLTQIKTRGTTVTVFGQAYDRYGQVWYHVQLWSGLTGYIRGDLLSIGDGTKRGHGSGGSGGSGGEDPIEPEFPTWETTYLEPGD